MRQGAPESGGDRQDALCEDHRQKRQDQHGRFSAVPYERNIDDAHLQVWSGENRKREAVRQETYDNRPGDDAGG